MDLHPVALTKATLFLRLLYKGNGERTRGHKIRTKKQEKEKGQNKNLQTHNKRRKKQEKSEHMSSCFARA